jgi:hypothetical protein
MPARFTPQDADVVVRHDVDTAHSIYQLGTPASPDQFGVRRLVCSERRDFLFLGTFRDRNSEFAR